MSGGAQPQHAQYSYLPAVHAEGHWDSAVPVWNSAGRLEVEGGEGGGACRVGRRLEVQAGRRCMLRPPSPSPCALAPCLALQRQRADVARPADAGGGSAGGSGGHEGAAEAHVCCADAGKPPGMHGCCLSRCRGSREPRASLSLQAPCRLQGHGWQPARCRAPSPSPAPLAATPPRLCACRARRLRASRSCS